MRPVKITWWDHSFADGEIAEPMKFSTVGHLIEEHPGYYVLAVSVHGDGTLPEASNLETMCILKCATTEILMLRSS